MVEKLIKKILSSFDVTALRIVAIYLFFGLIWIFFSDSLLGILVSDHEKFKQYSIYKGWFYISFISILLYILISKTLKEKTDTEQSLHASEDRWKFALEGAGDGVWDWNMETDEVFRSARWKEIY